MTTGASDDLRKVHDISRSMITMYGMGTELISKQLPAEDHAMSDHTRRMVDEEQQYLTSARGLRLHAARERGARARGHRALVAAYRGSSADLPGSLVAKSLEPGPAGIAAAEAEHRS